MRLAVVGGTFDPPHVAHLVVAECAYRQLGVDQVAFIPAGDPWQKATRPMSPSLIRLEMTRRAVADVPYFSVDDREVRRVGPSYSVITVEELLDEGHEPVLVLGADAAAGMRSWHRSSDLSDVEVAVVARPGTDRWAVEEGVAGRLVWLDAPRLDLSGTELRQRAVAGHSLRFVVPDAVCEYIDAEGVYD